MCHQDCGKSKVPVRWSDSERLLLRIWQSPAIDAVAGEPTFVGPVTPDRSEQCLFPSAAVGDTLTLDVVLLSRNYPGLTIRLEILDDETHMMGINATVMRGLRSVLTDWSG